jgi:hypothetical protein
MNEKKGYIGKESIHFIVSYAPHTFQLERIRRKMQ